MAGLNKIILVGNLGQDVEMRFTTSGKAVANFTLAVNEGQETEWFNITAWQKTAELCNQYLSKGDQVCLEGRVTTQKWESEDGVKHYKTIVVANKVVFLGKRDTESPSGDLPEGSFNTSGDLPEGDLDPNDIPF